MKKSISLFLCFLILFIGYTIKYQMSQYDASNIKESVLKDSLTPPITNRRLINKIIVVDAGHGINSYNKQERIAPNSNETKSAFAQGTRGRNLTEEQLNLTVALKLQEKLKSQGANVYMTRTEHNCDMTNIDRAEYANDLNADLSIKIHADGNNDKSVHGISVLVPGNQYISDDTVINESRKLGECVLEELVKETEATNRGISVRNDLTGFNWTTVPVILIEIGFMTNTYEDNLLETDDYQVKIVNGIVNGINEYYDIKVQ